MKHHSYNTILKNRILWFDGESSYDSDNVISLIKQGYNVKFVNNLTIDIEQYNKLAPPNNKICIKSGCNPLKVEWNIPEEYKQMDIIDYICDKHSILCNKLDINSNQVQQREERLAKELVLYNKLKLFGVLRTIIYIINTLTVNNVVWGVGRGSSVSSYVLFIIGAHDVDSFTYNLDITDFLHD